MREAKLASQGADGWSEGDRLHERLAETFARDTPNPAICVADGFGVRVRVERGRLVVADGLGTHRRERRYAKATHGLSRLVVLASTGAVGLDALRWCAGAGVGVVVLDPFSGELHLTSGGTSNNDPRLRRAQAVAMATPVGLEVTRYLVGSKLAGQASVAGRRLQRDEAARTIARLAGDLEACESLEEVRHVEATAANVYWNAWCDIDVRFVRKDEERVPDHWRRFEGRRSAVNVGTSRSATDPVNALLNYGYRLLEAESRLACLAVGLDPGLGILHADVKGRDSMVLDLMEAARPVVDGYVLDLLGSRPLMKSDFAEDRRGVVRLLPPLSHRLGEAMPTWAGQLGPVVQQVARLIGSASPYDVSVPGVLASERHRDLAAREPNSSRVTARRSRVPGPNPGGLRPRAKQRRRPAATNRSVVPHAVCRGCGAALEAPPDRLRPRRLWCSACLQAERAEVDVQMVQAARDAAEHHRAETGVLPSHTEEAQRRRRIANRRHKLEELAAANESSPIMRDVAWYEEHVAPRLPQLSLAEIASAIGVSTSAASKFRRGLRVPSPRHWPGLCDLVQSSSPPETLGDAEVQRCEEGANRQ